MGGIDESLKGLSLQDKPRQEDDEAMIRHVQSRLEQVRQKRRHVRDLRARQNGLRANLVERRNEEDRRQDVALGAFRSVTLQRKTAESALNECQEWNAMNDCFHIWHYGPFGTMNGLRLGSESPQLDSAAEDKSRSDTATPSSPIRKPAPRFLAFTNHDARPKNSNEKAATPPPPIRVPWNEINAALGQVALLLATLEKKLHSGIKYSHEIVPLGSTSKMGVRRGEGQYVTYYNLFSDDGGFQFFGKRNFNTALQCLVDCVVEASRAIEMRDRTISMPHTIVKDPKGESTIGGLSIAYGIDGAQWTKVMKYLLTDIKHLMVFRVFGLWDESGTTS